MILSLGYNNFIIMYVMHWPVGGPLSAFSYQPSPANCLRNILQLLLVVGRIKE